ncbi:hypothetical protein SEA_BUBBABEAR_63 [Microbacterium phage BubbaBear]|uniref:hypothetical protein n=1 Tax=Microbacterium phage BubbaBear TaxID=2572529 RepID=UPI0010C52D56|nr:hypothetical protein QDW44_gp63 [Microbacterium phage BubbaBear]QCG77324.1 hypothetical protein SEA_BUBBABEAR_63 [Microbacterium phage BubbaBear]
MRTDFRDLAVGDWVLLTGPDWGVNNGKTVVVERKAGRQAVNDSVVGVGTLTDSEGYMYGADYAIERVATQLRPDQLRDAEPAKPTTQGYTLSLYVSKTAAAEFPGETQELASITIAHDDLELLLRKGRGILEVVQDG